MRGPKFKGENTFQDYNKVSHKSVGFKIETRKNTSKWRVVTKINKNCFL